MTHFFCKDLDPDQQLLFNSSSPAISHKWTTHVATGVPDMPKKLDFPIDITLDQTGP